MKRSIALLVPALAIAIAACSAAASPSAAPTTASTPSPAATTAAPQAPRLSASAAAMAKDIVQTATEAGSFKTLLTAVKAAGLVETLQGEGPFTVFAPTDAAFAALPAGTLDGLLKDPAALKKVLLYHVVSGVGHVRQGRRAHLGHVGRGIADRHLRQGRKRLSERQRQGRDARCDGVEWRHPRHRQGHPAAGRADPRTTDPTRGWGLSPPAPPSSHEGPPRDRHRPAHGRVESVDSLFVFFDIFALTMWLQYRRVGRWKSYVFGERAYFVLSLVAKSTLAWQVFAGTLAG